MAEMTDIRREEELERIQDQQTNKQIKGLFWYFGWTLILGIPGVFCTVLGSIFLSITLPNEDVMCEGRSDPLVLAGIILLPIGTFFIGISFVPCGPLKKRIETFKQPFDLPYPATIEIPEYGHPLRQPEGAALKK